MKILVAGELNVDLVLQSSGSFPAPGREVLVDDATLTLGSASAICAAGLAKLENHVVFAGKVGADTWGDLCIDSLRQLGVDTALVVRDPAVKTGLTVSITSASDRALITYLGSIAELRENDIRDQDFQGVGHLHVSSFFLQVGLRPGLRALFARASRLGLTTSLDPGFDPLEEWTSDLLDVLTEVDIFLPNEVELHSISGSGDCLEALRNLRNGRTITVAKLGADGCIAIVDGSVVSVPAFRVMPVDTTGAGDSFNAGFLSAWLRGKPIADAMQFGSACGALATQALGGTAAQPAEIDANNFIAANFREAK